mgnify:CR=1 FL=1|jgi:hypothetical protein
MIKKSFCNLFRIRQSYIQDVQIKREERMYGAVRKDL